jgi:hypothetical protein
VPENIHEILMSDWLDNLLAVGVILAIATIGTVVFFVVGFIIRAVTEPKRSPEVN